MKNTWGFTDRHLHKMPNVFGGSRGTITKQGGKGSTRYTMGQGLTTPLIKPYRSGQIMVEPVRKIFKRGVGKDGIAKPKTGIISGRAISSRPVVKGMDTQGRVVKKAKKYWMWIVAAIIGYFLLKGK